MANVSSINNHDARLKVEQVLKELQDELNRLGYWKGQLENPERTNSNEPFCADTLEFTEWLQWVFIPRMRTVIRNDMQLPFRCDVTPRMEIWTMESSSNVAGELVTIMQRTDSLINRFYVR